MLSSANFSRGNQKITKIARNIKRHIELCCVYYFRYHFHMCLHENESEIWNMHGQELMRYACYEDIYKFFLLYCSILTFLVLMLKHPHFFGRALRYLLTYLRQYFEASFKDTFSECQYVLFIDITRFYECQIIGIHFRPVQCRDESQRLLAKNSSNNQIFSQSRRFSDHIDLYEPFWVSWRAPFF